VVRIHSPRPLNSLKLIPLSVVSLNVASFNFSSLCPELCPPRACRGYMAFSNCVRLRVNVPPYSREMAVPRQGTLGCKGPCKPPTASGRYGGTCTEHEFADLRQLASLCVLPSSGWISRYAHFWFVHETPIRSSPSHGAFPGELLR
jgi:hypothetical protein